MSAENSTGFFDSIRKFFIRIYQADWDKDRHIVIINISIMFIFLFIYIIVLTIYTNRYIENNLKKSLMGGKLNNETTFTLYYVEWCPHCKVVKPEWTKLENDNELEHIIFVKIDCEENEDIVKEKNIEGFPTILLTHNGKEIGYNGGREYADFKNYLLNL